jgi:hypothetical protein
VHLYQGTSEQFIGDATQNRMDSLLTARFFDEFRYKPSPSEINSWRSSLLAMVSVLQLADLRDQGVLVELKLPLSSKRLDVMITGGNPDGGDNAVIVELKQWTAVERSNITDCVVVNFGGKDVDHLHPSRQVAQYQRYLQDRPRHSRTARSPSMPAPTCTSRSTTQRRRSSAPTSTSSSRTTRRSRATRSTTSRPTWTSG